MIKKLSILLLRSFVGPFIVTFLVAMFIFEMQFVWVYLDDLMGRGLDFWVILKLLVFASARIVNLALPLAILMSGIMTMGALAENYELTAMKSSGISLWRIMRPLIVFHIILAIGSFVFANNVWPIANLKFRTLLYSIVQQRPALNLENGVFYNGIEGISIRVQEKNETTGELKDILIYDHRDSRRGNGTVIRAESGMMEQTSDKRFLILTMNIGYTYDEQSEDRKRDKQMPHIRSRFDKSIIRLDLSSLAFSDQSEDVFRNSFEMMTIEQLSHAIDSLQVRKDSVMSQMSTSAIRTLHINGDSTKTTVIPGYIKADSIYFFDQLPPRDRSRAISNAKETSRRMRDAVVRQDDEVSSRSKFINRHKIEWHRKFTLAIACLVLFFVGAPLGAIVRKGGLGLPTLLAFILFIVFQLLTIAGEKMTKSGFLDPVIGMWMATVCMLPLSIWLTYKANKEARLFDIDGLMTKVKQLFSREKKKNTGAA